MRQFPFADWILVFQALPILIFSRVLILFLPFRRIASAIGTLNCVTPLSRIDDTDLADVMRVGVILKALSKYLPWRSMCLEQALAGMILLRFKGVGSTIYFGVRQVDKAIMAHAWLRRGDQIITGAAGRECFTVVFTVACSPQDQSALEPFERSIANTQVTTTMIPRQ